MAPGADDVVTVVNRQGGASCLLVCDHASNRMPEGYGTLGLPPEEMTNHTAWDPGALEVARHLSRLMDAPLVASNVSRLVIDCNRAFTAANLIAETAEGKPVPGNLGLDVDERTHRITAYHEPFHDAIDTLLAERPFAAVVSVHSFTPVFFGKARPWHIGILHDADARLADVLMRRLEAAPGIVAGRNEPYSPADGVYYTLERHGTSQGLAAVMIEIRNDRLRDPGSAAEWAELLAPALAEGLAEGLAAPTAFQQGDRLKGGRIA